MNKDEQSNDRLARLDKFLMSQNGCFPNERLCKGCAVSFAASENATLVARLEAAERENVEYREMVDAAEQIEFEGSTIRKGLLKWRFVNHEPKISDPLFDSAIEAYRAMEKTK